MTLPLEINFQCLGSPIGSIYHLVSQSGIPLIKRSVKRLSLTAQTTAKTEKGINSYLLYTTCYLLYMHSITNHYIIVQEFITIF